MAHKKLGVRGSSAGKLVFNGLFIPKEHCVHFISNWLKFTVCYRNITTPSQFHYSATKYVGAHRIKQLIDIRPGHEVPIPTKNNIISRGYDSPTIFYFIVNSVVNNREPSLL
jgi:hypothetical protein